MSLVASSKLPKVWYPIARDGGPAVYRQIVTDIGAQNISVMAISSDGHIFMSVLLVAWWEEIPLPACVRNVSSLITMVRQNYPPLNSDFVDPLYLLVHLRLNSDLVVYQRLRNKEVSRSNF